MHSLLRLAVFRLLFQTLTQQGSARLFIEDRGLLRLVVRTAAERQAIGKCLLGRHPISLRCRHFTQNTRDRDPIIQKTPQVANALNVDGGRLPVLKMQISFSQKRNIKVAAIAARLGLGCRKVKLYPGGGAAASDGQKMTIESQRAWIPFRIQSSLDRFLKTLLSLWPVTAPCREHR